MGKFLRKGDKTQERETLSDMNRATLTFWKVSIITNTSLTAINDCTKCRRNALEAI